MKSLRMIFLCIVLIASNACSASNEEQAVTMVAQTMEARATGTALMDEAVGVALTQVADEDTPISTATPAWKSKPTTATTSTLQSTSESTATPTPFPPPTPTPDW